MLHDKLQYVSKQEHSLEFSFICSETGHLRRFVNEMFLNSGCCHRRPHVLIDYDILMILKEREANRPVELPAVRTAKTVCICCLLRQDFLIVLLRFSSKVTCGLGIYGMLRGH